MNAQVLARLYVTQRLEPLGVRVLSMPEDPLFLVYDGAASPAVVPCPLATHRSNTHARSKEDRETEAVTQADGARHA